MSNVNSNELNLFASFQVEQRSGLLQEKIVSSNSNLATQPSKIITFTPSPNYNARPPHTIIDLIVIHNISIPKGIFDTAIITAFFCNKFDSLVASGKLSLYHNPELVDLINLKVSSHLLICRNGTVIQYVPFTKRAWHAGKSQFAERENCNDFSIGIELEGSDDIPYTKKQYQQLARITQALIHAYPNITLERIVGHSTIAPQRKTDPGPSFDWSLYRQLIYVPFALQF